MKYHDFDYFGKEKLTEAQREAHDEMITLYVEGKITDDELDWRLARMIAEARAEGYATGYEAGRRDAVNDMSSPSNVVLDAKS